MNSTMKLISTAQHTGGQKGRMKILHMFVKNPIAKPYIFMEYDCVSVAQFTMRNSMSELDRIHNRLRSVVA